MSSFFFTSFLVHTLCTGLCAVSPFAYALCPSPATAFPLPRPIVAEIFIVSECIPSGIIPTILSALIPPSHHRLSIRPRRLFSCIGKRKESEDTILDHYVSIYPSLPKLLLQKLQLYLVLHSSQFLAMILVCNMRTLHSRKHYYLPSTGGRIFHFCSVELTTAAEPQFRKCRRTLQRPSGGRPTAPIRRATQAYRISCGLSGRVCGVIPATRMSTGRLRDVREYSQPASQPARPHYATPFAVASQLTSRPSTQAEAMRLETLPDTP